MVWLDLLHGRDGGNWIDDRSSLFGCTRSVGRDLFKALIIGWRAYGGTCRFRFNRLSYRSRSGDLFVRIERLLLVITRTVPDFCSPYTDDPPKGRSENRLALVKFERNAIILVLPHFLFEDF